jgi:hypothetical protein
MLTFRQRENASLTGQTVAVDGEIRIVASTK